MQCCEQCAAIEKPDEDDGREEEQSHMATPAAALHAFQTPEREERCLVIQGRVQEQSTIILGVFCCRNWFQKELTSDRHSTPAHSMS